MAFKRSAVRSRLSPPRDLEREFRVFFCVSTIPTFPRFHARQRFARNRTGRISWQPLGTWKPCDRCFRCNRGNRCNRGFRWYAWNRAFVGIVGNVGFVVCGMCENRDFAAIVEMACPGSPLSLAVLTCPLSQLRWRFPCVRRPPCFSRSASLRPARAGPVMQG